MCVLLNCFKIHFFHSHFLFRQLPHILLLLFSSRPLSLSLPPSLPPSLHLSPFSPFSSPLSLPLSLPLFPFSLSLSLSLSPTLLPFLPLSLSHSSHPRL